MTTRKEIELCFDIQNLVCQAFNVSIRDIRGKQRKLNILHARHALMVLLKECGLNVTMIGEIVRRDHSTVVQAIQSFDKKLEQNEFFARQVNQLRKKLRNINGQG